MEKIRPVDLKDCTTEEKVDGLIISATDWRVFNPYCHFRLRNMNGYVEAVFKSTLKGLDFGVKEPCRMLKIPLGRVESMNVSVVACVNKDAYLDFKLIGSEIRVIQLKVIDGMSGTATLGQGKWLGENTREVFQQDLRKFGNRILIEIKNLFLRHCTKMFGVRLVFAEFGQNAEYWRIHSLLENFNLEHIKQLIIHCAIDYGIKSAVFVWNNTDLNVLFGKKMGSKSYNVALLKGVGNFYFDIDLSSIAPPVKFVEVKCYSEMFKEVHRTTPLPFGVPEIAKDLLSPQEFALGFCKVKKIDWEAKMLNLRELKQLIDGISVGRSCSARCEVIASLTESSVTSKNIKQLPQIIKAHASFSPMRLCTCLRRISVEEMARHLEINLTPFVKTMTQNVESRIDALKTGNLNVLAPDKYFTLLAAEAIVCFAVYGNANYRRGRVMYPNWLLETLKIRLKDYRLDTEFQFPSWTFPVIDQETLKFCPLNMYASDILQSLGEECGIDKSILLPIITLDALMVNWGQGVLTMQELRVQLKEVANVLIHCVKKSAVYVDGKKVLKAANSGKMEILIKKYKSSKIARHFVTTLEFVENLFVQKEGLDSYCFVRWMIEMLIFIVKDDSIIGQLKSILRNSLEKELLVNNQIYPIPVDDSKFYVIAPLAGTKKCKFAHLTIVEQTDLCTIIQKFMNEHVVSKVISQVLLEKWNMDTTFQIAIDRMLFLMNDPKTELW